MLDRSETVIGELRVSADRRQRDRRLEFATDFTPRTWAIESASGLGALLAQQLVAAGETVQDVPPTLSARVRLLDAGCTDKTDPHEARAAAIVALRHTRLRQVALVDHTAVLRLLADRHDDLTGLRTQAICRLHALLCSLIPGGANRLQSAERAGQILRTVRPTSGIGPLGAAIIVGHTGERVDGRPQAVRAGPARRRRWSAPSDCRSSEPTTCRRSSGRPSRRHRPRATVRGRADARSARLALEGFGAHDGVA